MNNNDWKKFVIFLVKIISFNTYKTNYTIKTMEQGTEYFNRLHHSRERQTFRGWADICLANKSMGAGVFSIGEIESKGDCLSQLGIYAAGQFGQNIKKKKNSIHSYL